MNERDPVSRPPLSTIEKPWGGEELLAHTQAYALKRIRVNAGSRASLQLHRRKSESLFLLSGRMRIEIGDTPGSLVSEDFLPGSVVDVPRGTVHRVTAIEDSVLIEVSTPELDDVVRIEDDYGR